PRARPPDVDRRRACRESGTRPCRSRVLASVPLLPRKEGGVPVVTVNVVVLAGTVSADPVERRMPSGDEVTELRLSVPESGKRLLPPPVAAWHATVGTRA